MFILFFSKLKTTLRTATGEEVENDEGLGRLEHKELGKIPRYLRKNVDP